MATTVAELTVKVAADLASFRASMTKLNKDLEAFISNTEKAATKAQTAFDKLDQPIKNTSKAVKQATIDSNKYQKTLESLREKYDPLYAAAQKYQRALKEIALAEQKAGLEADKAKQARIKARSEMNSSIYKISERENVGWRVAQKTLADQTIIPNRGSDIAAYAVEMDKLRTKFNPLFAVISQYKKEQEAIRNAHSVGAISTDEMSQALARERAQALETIASIKGLKQTTEQRSVALSELRTKYDPIYTATQKYNAAITEITQAEKDNILTINAAIAARGREATALNAVVYAAKQRENIGYRTAQNIITNQTIIPNRGADVAAYGLEMDRLRAKFNPLFAAQQKYRSNLAEIKQANDVGAISSKEMAKAIENENKSYREFVKSLKAPIPNKIGGGNPLQNSLLSVRNIAATLGIYFSAKEIIDYADAWTAAGNKIAAAAQISGRSGRSLEAVNEIATETRTNLSGTVDLYARLLRSTKDVANSEQEVAQATATVNKAFKTGGADVQEQRAGLLQLSQALGSGMLQGDELRSIRENAPVLAQAIADYFGTTIAGLKKLGSEGQLTSDKVFKAILAAQSKIDMAYAQTNQTIGESFTMVSNALTEYIGKTNQATSVGARLVSGLKALADNFEVIADTTLKLASVIAAALIGRAIGGMIVKLGMATAEVFKFMAALRAAQGLAGIATAFGGAAAAAGPLGAVIGTVLVGALVAFGTSGAKASDEAVAFQKALDQVKKSSEAAANAVDNVTAAKKRQQEQQAQLQGEIDAGLKKEESQRKDISKLMDLYIYQLKQQQARAHTFNLDPGFTDDNIQALQDLSDKLKANKINSSELMIEMDKLKTISPIFEKIVSKLKDMGIEFRAIQQTLGGLNAQLKTIDEDGHFADIKGYGVTARNNQAKQDFFSAQFDIADNSKFEKLVDKEIKRLQEVLKNDVNAPKNITDQEIRAAAEKNVSASLQAKSLDTAIEKYVNNVVGAESGGKANVKNPLSSATGVGQFIESTWLSLFKEMFPEEAKTKTKQQILDLRNDVETSKVLIAQYAKENAQALKNAGITVDEAALHLAHFLGPAGAIKVLQAPPGTPIKGLLPDSVISANQSILGNNATVDTVRGYAEKRAGMNTPNAQAFGAKEEFGFTLEGWQQAVKNREAMVTAQKQLNPLQTDYGKAVAEEQAAEEALNYAREHGLDVSKEVHDINELLHGDLSKLSPAAREQAQAMRDYANSMGDVEAKANQLNATQDRMKQNFEDLRTTSRDVMQGFVQDLLDGKSAAEALSNALKKIADKLLDKAFDLLFNSKESGGSGIFDSILHAFGFASGGYTGDGGKYEPAGVVHKGEYVLNQNATRKLGVGNLDRLNKGLGYANGGYVTGISNASMGSAGISGGGAKSQLQIHLVTDNAAIAGIADARIKNASPSIVAASVKINQTQTRDNFGQYVTNYNARNA